MKHKQGGHKSLPENKGHKNKYKQRKEQVQDKTQEKKFLNESECDIKCLFACMGAQKKTRLFRLQMKVKQDN